MKVRFIGVGSAFTTAEYYQSNAVIESDSGRRLLLDCGGDARFALTEAGLKAADIDAVYVSHLHADHVGGLEWLAFTRYFSGTGRPRLFCVRELMRELWEGSLRGGLESVEEKVMNLTDYFDCRAVPINGRFLWEGILFTPVQTVHIMSGYKIVHSYGLVFQACAGSGGRGAEPAGAGAVFPAGRRTDTFQPRGPRVFFTADTQFCPSQITKFYKSADLIFHDCETAPFHSRVHAHYDDLKTLPPEVKGKIWLYHYQPNPAQDPPADGFHGFVRRGQTFEIGAA